MKGTTKRQPRARAINFFLGTRVRYEVVRRFNDDKYSNIFHTSSIYLFDIQRIFRNMY